MKIKLREIVNCATGTPANQETGAKEIKAPIIILQETSLPIKVSYRLKRLISKLQPIITVYEEKKNELIKELGTENEDKTISVKTDKLKEFFAELNDLLDTDEEIDFEPIKLDELGDVKIESKNIIDFIFVE